MLPAAIPIAIAFFQAAIPAGENTTTGSIRLFDGEFLLPPLTHWREERIMSAPMLKLSVDLGTEKNVKGTMSMLSRQLLDIDVLSARELRLKFVQNNSTTDINFGQNRKRHSAPLPLDGKTILSSRGEDGRWSAKFDSRRRATPAESSALHVLTHLWADGVYPNREVAIGESWKIEARDFKNLFGPEFQKPTGAFEFTLARVVEHEGHECAKITGKGKLKSQTKTLGGGAPGSDDAPLDVEMDLTIEIYRSIELAMDLSVIMKGELELSNKQDEDALSYNASSPVEFTRTFKKR